MFRHSARHGPELLAQVHQFVSALSPKKQALLSQLARRPVTDWERYLPADTDEKQYETGEETLEQGAAASWGCPQAARESSGNGPCTTRQTIQARKSVRPCLHSSEM